jgi:hypothetical protein
MRPIRPGEELPAADNKEASDLAATAAAAAPAAPQMHPPAPATGPAATAATLDDEFGMDADLLAQDWDQFEQAIVQSDHNQEPFTSLAACMESDLSQGSKRVKAILRYVTASGDSVLDDGTSTLAVLLPKEVRKRF